MTSHTVHKTPPVVITELTVSLTDPILRYVEHFIVVQAPGH